MQFYQVFFVLWLWGAVLIRPERKLARTHPSLAKVRGICLALPDAHEVEAWGEPTFRVRNKLFAMFASPDNHHGGGRPSLWIKSTHVNQDLLMIDDPARYFSPPYVGPSGWVGVYLDKRPSWKAIGALITDAYRLTAPRKLIEELSAR